MVEEESSGGEFSEDEFDPIEADYANESEPSRIPDEFESHNEKYENIPMMVRPAPEGAEADAEYDVPELNESFEKEEKVDLDISLESSRLADMSSDSLMVVRTVDTSFDRDSMESVEQEDEVEEEKSVIESQEGRTIILSPGMALIRYTFTVFFSNPPELQKRANRANQLVLFFLAGANFWEKHAKNCAIMSLFWEKHAKNCAIMSLFWC